MPKNFCLSEDINHLIEEIIEKYELHPVQEVKYVPGSESGDGYVSKTVAVSISTPSKTLDLFLKCALDVKQKQAFQIDKFYANEIFFYDVVRPAYLEFVRKRLNQNSLRNIPKCYGTSKKNIIALENLKKQRFKLFDRGQVMNDNHLQLVLKTFAKVHAIAFAFKDQNRGKYEELVDGAYDLFSTKNGEDAFISIMRGAIKDFVRKLDPVEDKEIVARCEVEELLSGISSADRNLDEYSILTQGDCWCNNMMFLYEDEESTNDPIDMVLIDWQLLRPASPTFDISYFFLTVASEDTLKKTNYYLKLYHDELSKQLKLLGSEPDVLYPFSALMKHWKDHCRFGFGMATIIIKVMLSEKDEVINLETIDLENVEQLENLYPKFEKEEEFLRRMKMLARYMIANEYL
ncbi:hypothetical protein Trydic_g19654 [Trypoxylus dichotomus]